jgi:hypothetical protein
MLYRPKSVRPAVAKIKIFCRCCPKNMVVIDAHGLAKTRLVAHACNKERRPQAAIGRAEPAAI